MKYFVIAIYIYKASILSFCIIKMALRRELTASQRAVVIALHQEGLSSRQIAQRVNCHQTTVSRLIKRFNDSGSTAPMTGRGRKRSSSTRDDRALVHTSLRNRFLSSSDLKRKWEMQCGVSVSTSTIRKRLAKAGLHGRRPRKKPLLTPQMRKARLSWAKEHIGWTEQQWNRVIFSDETKVNLFGSDGRVYVRRRSSEEYHSNCILPTTKHPSGQMVWGCISSFGIGHLNFVDGTVNGTVYKQILENNLMPTIRNQFGNVQSCIFQDDSAPCHRSRLVQEYKQTVNLQSLPWPGNSPDLNPIENCWHLMKSKIAEKKPTTKRELQALIVRVWHHELSQEYIQSLIHSMPRRCLEVVRARGGITKY